MAVALKFNNVLQANAASTRHALLNTSGVIPDVNLTGYADIMIYVPTSNLNMMFTTSAAHVGQLGDTPQDYEQIIAAGFNNLSGQPIDFNFNWEYDAGAVTDLSGIYSNVLTNATVGNANDGDNTGVYSFTSAGDTNSVTQNVPSILNLAGSDLDGDAGTQRAFLGTVWNNFGTSAVVNSADFLNPTMTVSALVDTLKTINDSTLLDWRRDLFDQAYEAYKYDVSYNRLSFSAGDKFTIPIQYTVAQEVTYDLSGSLISGGHSNLMLTFNVSGQDFTVMSTESVSTNVKYSLTFVAVGEVDPAETKA